LPSAPSGSAQRAARSGPLPSIRELTSLTWLAHPRARISWHSHSLSSLLHSRAAPLITTPLPLPLPGVDWAPRAALLLCLALAVAWLHGGLPLCPLRSVRLQVGAPMMPLRASLLRGPVHKAGPPNLDAYVPELYEATCYHPHMKQWYEELAAPDSAAPPVPCQMCRMWVSDKGSGQNGGGGGKWVREEQRGHLPTPTRPTHTPPSRTPVRSTTPIATHTSATPRRPR
jgi:hypothetical protein